jgi:hypothetical protein
MVVGVRATKVGSDTDSVAPTLDEIVSRPGVP